MSAQAEGRGEIIPLEMIAVIYLKVVIVDNYYAL